MATKKNPLSALLRTDDRQQAQEMQREHVLRSSVRQAGTYGVGVQRPLPISQTSLGRLSNSLGTVSGILGQFSAYQAQKEQAELKGDSLQSKLNLQEIASKDADLNLKGAMIQGDILDETVKQQSIVLDEAQTRREDAEWDYMLSQSNDEQVEKMIQEANDQVRRQKAIVAKAELGVEQANPGEHTESPLYGQRALRLLGATYAEEYDEYHRQQTKELIESLADNPNGSNLSREEATDLAQKTLRDFMLLKKLDPEGEVGKGFIQATDRLRAAKNPILASALMDESETLNTQNMIGAMKAAAELGPVDGNYGQGLISEAPWFAQLSGMSQAKAQAVLFGTQGDPARGIPSTPGLYGMMARTHDGAVKFQAFFDELTDELHINNRPFKELPEFDSLQAQVEEAVEKTAFEEVKKKNDVFSVAWEETADKLPKLSSSMSPEKIAIATANLIDINDTPTQLRDKLNRRFPLLAEQIAQISDDKLSTYAFDLVTNIKGGGDTLDAVTDTLLAQAVPHLQRADRRGGLMLMVQDISSEFATTPGQYSGVAGLLDSYLGGLTVNERQRTEGLTDAGGGFMVGEIDDLTNGAVTRYTRDLNNLNQEVLNSLPEGFTSVEFTKVYRERFKELNTNFKDELKKSFTKHAKINTDYAKELGGEYDKRKGLVRLVPPSDIQTIVKNHPNKTVDEIEKIAITQGEVKEAPGSTLRKAFGGSPQEAKAINEVYVNSKKRGKEGMEQYTEKEGEFYKGIERLSSRLAMAGTTYWMEDIVKSYDALFDEMNKAAADNYSVSVSTEKIKELCEGRVNAYYSSTAVSDKVNESSPSGKKGIFIVKMGDDFLNLKRAEAGEPGFYGDHPIVEAVGKLLGKGQTYGGGELTTHANWKDTRRDVVLGHRFFMDNQTPVTGLAFGSAEPTATDVEKISKASGWTTEDMARVTNAFGYTDSLSFIKSQYNNAYYSNQRKAKTK